MYMSLTLNSPPKTYTHTYEYLIKVPVCLIRTGFELYEVMKLGNPNSSMLLIRQDTLNRPTHKITADMTYVYVYKYVN